MLKKILLKYLIIGVVLSVIFVPWVEKSYIGIYIINVLNVLFYFVSLVVLLKIRIINKNLIFLFVFIYGFIGVGVLNIISWYLEGDFFVFSKIDAIFYHDLAVYGSKIGFFESLSYYSKIADFDDLGMIIVLRYIYLLIESNLLFNFFNILFGATISVILYDLCRNFMSKKYAIACAISYGISSYMLWFYSSGLKESVMVMLVLLSFHQYYQYNDSKKIINFVLFHLFAISLIWFRPALTVFIYAAILIKIVVMNKNVLNKTVVITAFLTAIVFAFSFLELYLNRFFTGGSFETLIQVREAQGMIIGSVPFTYSVNILAQLIGPLPTIISDNSPLSLYGSGLIFRVLLAFPFWIGVLYAFQNKYKELLPLLIFALLEMLSLALILEGLELRKSLPHLPMVYIIAFWFMFYFQRSKVIKKKRLNISFTCYSLVVGILIVIWNLR